MIWIDVHTHLNMLEISPEEALTQAQAAGVERLITIGTNPQDHQIVLNLAEKYQPRVFCTLGVHPHDANLFTKETDEFLLKHLDHVRVVAVGEIGLDFYYDNSPHEVQKQVFRRQLEIAAIKKLPVEIHTRDAEQETVEILKDFKGKVTGLFHCFTGTSWLAKQAIELGFDISFSGVVTFKNADELRETCKSVPLDRLHIETDAPFLAPVPQRGKKNQPAFVIHTAETVSRLHGISMEQLAEQTQKNAGRLFPKLGL